MPLFDKVIFLDIDGVCNNVSERFENGLDYISPERAGLVRMIALKTEAKIVYSTSWRLYPGNLALLDHAMKCAGILDMVVGMTPDFYGKFRQTRSDEISAWLKANPTNRYVIIDDMKEAGLGDHAPHFFKTSDNHGLTLKTAQKIIKILSRP